MWLLGKLLKRFADKIIADENTELKEERAELLKSLYQLKQKADQKREK